MIQTIFSVQAGKFTVNTGGPRTVGITDVAVPNVLIDPDGRQWFQPKDHFIWRTIAVSYPHCYCSAEVQGKLAIQYRDETAGAWVGLPGWGSNGRLPIYSENIEIDVTNFVRWDDMVIQSGDRVRFAIDLVTPSFDVSMANVPAAHNGVEMPVWVTVKVDHNLPTQV